MTKLDEILDKVMYKQDFWTKEVRREISDVEAKAQIKTLFLEIVGEDETLKTQSEYDKKLFGHPEADKYPGLQYVRQATRNYLRDELRERINDL